MHVPKDYPTFSTIQATSLIYLLKNLVGALIECLALKFKSFKVEANHGQQQISSILSDEVVFDSILVLPLHVESP